MSYAKLDSQEGTVSGTATVSLARRSRKLIITNDSANNLQFKLNSSESYGTLKPTETVSMEVSTRTVYLSGNGAYRIWNFG